MNGLLEAYLNVSWRKEELKLTEKSKQYFNIDLIIYFVSWLINVFSLIFS
jgi:hypothetical protein